MKGYFCYPLCCILAFLFLAPGLGGCSKADEEIIELKVLRQNVVFRSQADINSFMAGHKDAKRIAIDGNLTIGMPLSGGESSDITSLQPLSKLKEVRRNLLLTMNGQLLSLQGLENLDRVKGSLRIEQNGLQQGLQLKALTRVDSLIIRQNPALTALAELGQLSRINTLLIAGNAQLENLQGLGGIDSLVHLSLLQNTRLQDLSGLIKLQHISGLLSISQNQALESLSGLGLLQQIGAFSITANPLLTDLCALTPAVADLLLRHPDASQAELDSLMHLQANGVDPYRWDQLLADCQE
ncbi:hypothetical protein [Cesiribacter andamanensis]|uniref:Receptor L domain protein n=1 Tax=Cesiribacter andamanensis AMV16 TaxID=1279009 RepID=M7NT64_9BACT|nr:hypothetical protein [Cesiribacter andamanensis]EMR01674.1 Receptor L domain protein [Cesiribacter andamanensis AMV16]